MQLRYFILTETVYGVVSAIPFFIILWILYRQVPRPLPHRLGVGVWACYVMGIFTVTGIPSLYRLKFYLTVGLIPFDGFETAPRQFFLNLLLFMPVGFLLPLLWRNYRSFIKTVAAGFLLSLFIEVFQLFSYRTTDVDDLIMNTLGTVLGWVCFAFACQLFPGVMERFQAVTPAGGGRCEGDAGGRLLRLEPLFYAGACWLGGFLLQPFVSDVCYRLFF